MIPDVKKILFATDLSAGSQDVFHYAVSLARSYNASITILHVIEDAPAQAKSFVVDLMGKEAYKELEEEHEDHAKNILIGKRREVPIIRQALEKLRDNHQSSDGSTEPPIVIEDILVPMGKIKEEIIEQAQKSNCDIIVMGHRVHSIIAEAFLGSTTRSILRKLEKPVFLVPIHD